MKKTQRSTSLDTLALIHPNAAGLDIGSREIWASVPPDRDPEPVRRFGTFTPDLKRLVAWLVQCRIDTVAMESTGVYWIPVFELLEAAGLNAQLVEPRPLKAIPQKSLFDLTKVVLLANCIFVAKQGADHENPQSIISDFAHDFRVRTESLPAV